jgi:hypothetical protein
MKRFVVCLCLCGLLAVPALAIARPFPPDSHFQGRVEGDPNTYFGFGTAGPKRHKKVRHVAVALPMNCYSSDRGIVELRLHESFEILNLRYLFTHGHARAKAEAAKRGGVQIVRRLAHLKVFYGEADIETEQGSGEAYLFGQINRHGRARGSIHMKTHSDAFGKCYSGVLKWRAHRGARVDYPPAS